MLVEHKPDGYAAWCHRCSDKGWQSHPQPSLAERIARFKAVEGAENAAEASTAPPRPTEFNPSLWPLHARVWLYQGGFSNDAIQRHGFYYSEALDRVVLPVIRDGRVVYWQARGFQPGRPKYLNPDIDKPIAHYGEHGPLVVTEDILSAARVGEVGRGRAVLGTSLPDRHITALARESGEGPALVWLDNDKAGRKGRARISDQLRLAGVDVRIIRTPLDPKLYPRTFIEELIRSALK
ncbi:toprim domain-containing protein [Tsuneonella sp. HG222]